jgi:hypothetical protein
MTWQLITLWVLIGMFAAALVMSIRCRRALR